jgi:hypothetical protein
MYLREIAIHADPAIVDRFPGGFVSAFHRDACCVAESLTHRLSRKLKSEDISKLQFNFTDVVDSPPQRLTALNILWPFGFATYQSTSGLEEKKLQIGASMQDAMHWVASIVGWERSIIQSAFAESIARRFVLEVFSKRLWISPSRRFKARVFARLDIKSIEFYAVLFKANQKQEQSRCLMGTTLPEIGAVDNFVRGARWLSDTTFSLTPESYPYPADKLTVDLSDLMVA